MYIIKQTKLINFNIKQVYFTSVGHLYSMLHLSHYLTNLMHKICFTISFISCFMFRAHVLETWLQCLRLRILSNANAQKLHRVSLLLLLLFIGMCHVFFYICYLKNTDKCVRNICCTVNSKLGPIKREALS